MKKYLYFLNLSLQKSFSYKGRVFVWFFWDILPPLIMMFFWLAAFKTQEKVAGYNFNSLITYYLVVIFGRNLILNYPDDVLEREIMSGEINHWLIKPANLLFFRFIYEMAYKFLKLIYLIPLYVIIYFIFIKGKFFTPLFSLLGFWFFLLSAIVSFSLYFFIKSLIGISVFWFGQKEWLSDIQELTMWFLGGTLFPLDFLPLAIQKIAFYLPFAYIFYFPSQILIKNFNFWEIVKIIGIQFLWVFVFAFFLKKLYKAGLKKYSAFGG